MIICVQLVLYDLVVVCNYYHVLCKVLYGVMYYNAYLIEFLGQGFRLVETNLNASTINC